jgi:hypothetical protein
MVPSLRMTTLSELETFCATFPGDNHPFFMACGNSPESETEKPGES